jgi:hypothetical protein
MLALTHTVSVSRSEVRIRVGKEEPLTQNWRERLLFFT